MIKKLWLLFALLVSGQTFAGYFVTVTGVVISRPNISASQGTVSACYLTPSMAIASLPHQGYGWRVLSLDQSGTWSGELNYSGGGTFSVVSGTFSECAASPAVTAFPTFVGGISDPAVTASGVLGATGGGSGGGVVSTDVTALQATVLALQEQVSALSVSSTANNSALAVVQSVMNEPFDLTTGMAGFAFFFSTTIFFYGFSRSAGAVLDMVRRPLGRG